MLLFATNQTNFKQKQNCSVCSNFASIETACIDGLGCFHAYWQCMYWKEHFQFSLFHACCTFYQNFGLLEKDKIGSPVLLKGGWYGELGEGRGGGVLNSWWGKMNCKRRTHMFNMIFLGLRRWERGGLGAVSKSRMVLCIGQDIWVLHSYHKKAGRLLDPESPHGACNIGCHFASLCGREGVSKGTRLLW